MRFASREIDFWELRSAEASHKANPDTFEIPSQSDLASLKRGQAARLILDIESADENGDTQIQGERMWVIVSECLEDAYIGILDNQPASIEPAEDVYLCFGAEIPFTKAHVIDIGNPPTEYVEWQLKQKPERIWPRS